MRNAIIFDLDGTLWDAAGCAVDIWNRVLKKYHAVNFPITQDKVSALMGKTMEEIGTIVLPDLPETKRQQALDDFSREEVRYLTENGAIPYTGMEETIEALSKKYDLYIVSNCQDGYVQAFLYAHQLEPFFKDIEMSGRTGLEKGENIKKIMERNHIQSAVYVGDTAGDEKAAGYAQIPFIWAKYGFGKAVHPADSIDNITELQEKITKLSLFV